MCVVGPSECGKTRLVYNMLNSDTFYPTFSYIYYCYRHWQPVYEMFEKHIKNIQFVPVVDDFDVVDTAINSIESNRGDSDNKTLLIFDDVAEELLRNEKFSNLATSGRHKGISIIFIKHNLYQQGKHSVPIDKNTTHIILMKNPRVGRQIKILGSELGMAKFLEDCYNKAVLKEQFGHLLIDLTPNCNTLLRYSSNVASIPSFFWLPTKNGRPLTITDAETNTLYANVLERNKKRAQTLERNQIV